MKRYRSEKARTSYDGGFRVEVTSLAFLREPDGYGYIERHLLNASYSKAFRTLEKKGGHVYAPSEAVAADVHKYYRVPKEMIHVISDGQSQG